MKVFVLVENNANDIFKGEHGLSFFIEYNGKTYIIDSGKTGIFLENALKLGVDLSNVDAAFLSHGHYDHSDGFEELFKINKDINVYLQENSKGKEYYSSKKYIGISKSLLRDYCNRFIHVDGFKEVDSGVYICPHTTDGLNKRGEYAQLYFLCNGEKVPDDFSHEQTIVFEEGNDLFLFNSCSHGGVENIINEIKEMFPGKEIKAFFGGFHLMGNEGVNSCGFSHLEVEKLGNFLLKNTDANFYTGHCTGKIAGKWLKNILKERFVELHSGMVIDL